MSKPPLEGKISFETANVIIDWLADYSFKDTKEEYTNGSLLVPLFRVRQALEMYKDGKIQEFANFENNEGNTTKS